MDTLRAIAEWRTPFLDNLFLLLTRLGEEAVVILAVALLYWCISKKGGYTLGFAYFFSGLAVNTLKISCRIDRPWILDPDFDVVEAAKEHATSYSFPSGHTQSATALYGYLGLNAKKGWLRFLFLLGIPVVGFSRMYLGVHTPADVLVSFAVTAAFVLLFNVLFRSDELSVRLFAIAGIVLVLCSFGALAYALHLYNNGIIEYSYASDICKMLGAAVGFAVGCPVEQRFINFSTRTRSLWQQLFKLAVGIGVTLIIKSGLKVVFALLDSQSLIFDALRYGLVIIWVVLIWPAIFTRILSTSEEEEKAALD